MTQTIPLSYSLDLCTVEANRFQLTDDHRTVGSSIQVGEHSRALCSELHARRLRERHTRGHCLAARKQLVRFCVSVRDWAEQTAEFAIVAWCGKCSLACLSSLASVAASTLRHAGSSGCRRFDKRKAGYIFRQAAGVESQDFRCSCEKMLLSGLTSKWQSTTTSQRNMLGAALSPGLWVRA